MIAYTKGTCGCRLYFSWPGHTRFADMDEGTQRALIKGAAVGHDCPKNRTPGGRPKVGADGELKSPVTR